MQKQSQSFHFPYKKAKIDIGIVPYPVILVSIYTKKSFIRRVFIVDTGADVTTLPKFMARELDLNLKDFEIGRSRGIGKKVVKTWETRIKIKIGSEIFSVRCSFVSSNKIPPLLGKIDVFNRFNFYFDNDKEELVLTVRKLR